MTPNQCRRLPPFSQHPRADCNYLVDLSIDLQRPNLVGTAGLGDDASEVLDLCLGTAEGTEPLLGKLASALVLAVAKEFNDAALIGSKAVGKEV